MIGFCAVMFVMGVLIALGSYWISWEMQHAGARPGFSAMAYSDLARLFARKRPEAPAQARSIASSSG